MHLFSKRFWLFFDLDRSKWEASAVTNQTPASNVLVCFFKAVNLLGLFMGNDTIAGIIMTQLAVLFLSLICWRSTLLAASWSNLPKQTPFSHTAFEALANQNHNNEKKKSKCSFPGHHLMLFTHGYTTCSDTRAQICTASFKTRRKGLRAAAQRSLAPCLGKYAQVHFTYKQVAAAGRWRGTAHSFLV